MQDSLDLGTLPTERPVRAGDGIRTHDNNVGNVVLCQLSYTRKSHVRCTLSAAVTRQQERSGSNESPDYRLEKLPCKAN